MLDEYTDAQLHELEARCIDLLSRADELVRSNARLALLLINQELERREVRDDRPARGERSTLPNPKRQGRPGG